MIFVVGVERMQKSVFDKLSHCLHFNLTYKKHETGIIKKIRFILSTAQLFLNVLCKLFVSQNPLHIGVFHSAAENFFFMKENFFVLPLEISREFIHRFQHERDILDRRESSEVESFYYPRHARVAGSKGNLFSIFKNYLKLKFMKNKRLKNLWKKINVASWKLW